ncbi:hypothetical protein [Baekduia sp.]|jgi:hypothetical protein|uniref:hypothetical protein n=1 Tax=Baekduia sp. TaxID=2600305 RepID=UPI002E0C7328|nr:hypothetical protein [Baekduia sp.]
MDAWIALLARELALLAVLGIIGLGPVALLHRSVDRATRLALAPAYGLAIAVCVLVTTLWRVPAHRGWPLLVGMMVVSLAMAFILARRAAPDAPERRPLSIPRRELAQLVVLVAVVLIALSLPMAILHSTGPAGGYRIADASGYVAQIDGAQRESIHAAKLEHAPWRDLTIQMWSGAAGGYQQIGFDAVAAHMNELLGLHATDTHSAFLICLILIGALAAWAVVRQVTATRSWAAVLAGALFAGPFFRTLYLEGSEGAIAGIQLVLPALLAGWWALRYRRFWDLLAFGLMAAGLQTLYPLYVPPLVVGGAIVLAVLGVGWVRRHGWSTAAAAKATGMLLGALAIAAVLTPVAFERNVRYWKLILQGKQSYAGLPPYDLPPAIVPSWLLQTRELYFLPHLDGQPLSQLLVSLAVPLLIVAAIAYGLRRRPVALGALAVIVAAVLFANRTATSDDCSYCAQRSLLVIAPLAMALFGIGLAAMRSRGGRVAVAALPIALITVVAVGSMARHSALRLQWSSYVFDEQINTVLKQLPDQQGPVQIEGFGMTYLAPMVEPLAYNRVNEVTDAPVSIAAETDSGRGLIYLGGPRPIGLEFRPDYKYILTRFPDIVVPTRRTIKRSGPVALEQRTGDLDVTVTDGLVARQAWQEDPGTAWVVTGQAVHFWVIGGPVKRVWLKVRLQATVPVKIDPAAVTSKQTGGEIVACLPVDGPPPVRRADLYFTLPNTAGPPPKNAYAVVSPPTGAKLTEMAVSSRSCRPST